jgi:alpha-maltose-1-phosphate synthase
VNSRPMLKIFVQGNRDQTKLRVALAASGRFHLLDVARELDALGADVRFYSYVSKRRAQSFGLRARCHVALLPFLFPLVTLERLFPRLLPVVTERMMCWALDIAVILRMRRCDVFICMSGLYVLAARFAKWRFGALIHLHRSSRHVLSQQEILANLPNAQQLSRFMVQRELEGYDIADHIIVPSTHVAESFSPWPDQAKKLFLNPLGVDIDQFPLAEPWCAPDQPTVLFVGHWSYRKGVDVLVEAIKALEGVRLIHVGALSDAPFPSDPRFVHHDHVAQRELTEFYRSAHVFVLPSREDGFGVVLSQALSSGLKIVCTDRTGGPDLAKLPDFPRLIRVVRADDPLALRHALAKAISDADAKAGVAPITQSERQLLSWKCHAERDLLYMEEALRAARLPM